MIHQITVIQLLLVLNTRCLHENISSIFNVMITSIHQFCNKGRETSGRIYLNWPHAPKLSCQFVIFNVLISDIYFAFVK